MCIVLGAPFALSIVVDSTSIDSLAVAVAVRSTLVESTSLDTIPPLVPRTTGMPRPPNTRDEDPEVALVVKKLKESQVNVARLEKERQAARSQRRQAAVEAFAVGISWRRIAEYAGYGSAQAAQQDVTSESSLTRRSSD